MNEEDPIRRMRKLVGHTALVVGGAGIRAGIDANRDLTPLQKEVANVIVTALQGIGHAWVDSQ